MTAEPYYHSALKLQISVTGFGLLQVLRQQGTLWDLSCELATLPSPLT